MIGIFALVAAFCASMIQQNPMRNVVVSSGGGTDPGTPDIMWIKYTENTGTSAADTSSGAANSLTLSSSAMWTSGKTGFGVAGNGSSRYATWQNTTTMGSVVTVSFWHKEAAWSGATEEIIESSNAFEANNNSFLINSGSGAGGFIEALLHGSGTSGQIREDYILITLDGNWHFYAFVLDNSTTTGSIKIYKDSVLQTSSNASNSKTGTGAFGNFSGSTILARNSGASRWSGATIDDLEIYNRELTASEVLHVYLNPQ
jgi:hypothetical protein